MSFDHVLVIGFGGPTKPEEIKPFLQNVTRGIPIPEERLREVEHHYHEVGGFSPYNEYTFRLFERLREKLQERQVNLPLFLGMRNWNPYLKEALAEIKRRGLKRGIGLILAPHRSDASYEKYIRNVEDAKREAGALEINYEYLKPWFDHPGFIHAQTDEARKVLARIPAEDREAIPLLFSAHSIPMDMAAKSQYAEEVRASAALVAGELGNPKWHLAWQSRSGSPRQPWLEPDICSAIRELKRKGESSVLVIPVGFLCDNVEVLFDLDIEARQEAEKQGMKFYRASTVMDHPSFAAMFAELIQELFAGFRCH
jgi:protoporphyrin/coproporphyrin ferrochelatase